MATVNGNRKLPTSTDTLFIDAYRYQRNNGQIPLLFLYTNYEQISPSALSQGLFTVTSDSVRLKDVAERKTSPYNTKTCFTFAPLQDSIVQFNSINFALPAEFWMMSGITSVSIDFGDGNGFRTLNQGNTVTIYYNTEGRKYLKAKITTAKGDIYAQSTIYYQRPTSYFQPDSVWNITVPPVYTSFSNYLGTQKYVVGNPIPMGTGAGSSCTDGSIFNQINCDINPGAQVQIINGCDRVFDKPIIIVQPFDPKNEIGNYQLYKYFNQNYPSYSTGFISSMRSLGYDFVIVTFTKNTDFIENNAAVLEQVIDKVNATKTGNNKITVIGWSMGGLVTRWCLKDMEDRGVTHNVDKYFSYDAPQQGANALLSMQFYLQEIVHDMPYLKWSKTINQTIAAAQSPAARQMLITQAEYNTQPFTPAGYTLDAVRAKFAQALLTKGYPQKATCYGISLGRGNNTAGTTNGGNGTQFGNFGPGSALFSGTLTYILANVQAIAYAVPQNATSTILDYQYAGLRVVHIFHTPVPLYFLRLRHVRYTGAYPYDDAPGGYENTQTQTVKGLRKYLGIATTFGHYGHNFIPVASALDLQNQNYVSNNLFQSSNMYYGIDNNILNPGQVAGNTLSTPSFSPFQYVNTYTSDCGSVTCADYDENLQTQESANWNEYHGGYISIQATQFLIRKITNSNPSFTCSALDFCTSVFQITGPSNVCTTATYQIAPSYSLNGVNVQWSFPNGTLNIISGQGTPTINVAKAITGNETITVVLTNSCGQQTTYQLPITVGAPVTITGNPSSSCSGSYQRWVMNASSASNGTNWNWYVSYKGTNSDIRIYNPAAATTNIDVSGGGIVNITYTDACGIRQNGGSGITVYSNCHAFVMTPNPAQSNITIQSNSPTTQNQSIKQIKILDQSGNVRKIMSYSSLVNSTQVDISNLLPGVYSIQISNDVISETQKLIIQR